MTTKRNRLVVILYYKAKVNDCLPQIFLYGPLGHIVLDYNYIAKNTSDINYKSVLYIYTLVFNSSCEKQLLKFPFRCILGSRRPEFATLKTHRLKL